MQLEIPNHSPTVEHLQHRNLVNQIYFRLTVGFLYRRSSKSIQMKPSKCDPLSPSVAHLQQPLHYLLVLLDSTNLRTLFSLLLLQF
jgi:hypothetical protein